VATDHLGRCRLAVVQQWVDAAVRGLEGGCGIEAAVQHSHRSFLVGVESRMCWGVESRMCCGAEVLAFAGAVELGSFVVVAGCRSVERSCSRIEASSIFRSQCSLGFVGTLGSAEVVELDSRTRMRQVVVGILDFAAGGRSCLAAEDSGLAVPALEA
jgi:hypothetical protein